MQSTSGTSRESSFRVRVWIAFAVLGVCLVVLGVTPVLVSVRTRALRTTITEMAEPTISAVAGIERSVAGELAALRGFALHGDSSFIRTYRELRDEERADMLRLLDLAPELDPAIERHARRLEVLTARWHRAVGAALAAHAEGGSGSVIADLDPYALRSEARSLRRSAELFERLRRRDIAEVEGFEVWLNRVMIVLAALAAASLALLGRRLHSLAAASDADRERLRQEVGRRARLIRGISHDLKNPLGVADAHAELLEMGVKGSLGSEQRESIAAIRRSVRNTVRLIDDLLHLARAERGEVPIHPVGVDFAQLVAQIAADVRSRAEAEDLRLEVAVPARPVEGVTDPRRVREILENLLSNAIRYTPAGGRVDLGVETDPNRAAIRIVVADTGPGIAPADQSRIFDEFERATSSAEGSGLGLAISREMARLLGGDIELESAVGAGSRFTLVLPLTSDGVELGR